MGTHEANRAEHSGKPVGDDLDDLDGSARRRSLLGRAVIPAAVVDGLPGGPAARGSAHGPDGDLNGETHSRLRGDLWRPPRAGFRSAPTRNHARNGT